MNVVKNQNRKVLISMARVTKRENLEAVFAILADADEVELADFIAGEIALVVKRASAPRKPTKEQLANVGLKADIVEFLAVNGAQKATAVANALDITVQKATALLTQLRKTDEVVRDEDGKEVTFRVAE
jgi:hypothetical protein